MFCLRSENLLATHLQSSQNCRHHQHDDVACFTVTSAHSNSLPLRILHGSDKSTLPIGESRQLQKREENPGKRTGVDTASGGNKAVQGFARVPRVDWSVARSVVLLLLVRPFDFSHHGFVAKASAV